MVDKAPPVPAPKQPVPKADARTPVPGGGDAALVAERLGLLDDGAFILPFGPGLRLGPELLGKAKVEIDRKHLPALPGLRLDTVGFDPRNRNAMISIKGKTAIPLTEERDFALNFGRDGKAAAVNIQTKATLDWIGRPDLRLSWAPDTGLAASVTVAAAKFLPASLAKVATATGDISLSLDQGKLSGALDTVIIIRDVLKAEIKGGFTPEGLAAKVALDSQSKWLGEVKATGAIDAGGVLTAKIEKQATELPSPIKGLSFKGGVFSVALNSDRTISGGFSGLTLDYAGLATATASFMIEGGKYAGSADLDLSIPGLTAAKGHIAMKDGKLSGAFGLEKDAFPKGLPLKSGKISGSVSDTGALAFSGAVEVTLGPAGTGKLMASYTDAGFSIGAEVDLAVPGLQTASFKIAYNGTDLAGEGELAIDPALLSGIQGRMKITYAAGLWAGETTLGYTADDGKLAGTITVRARQAEDNSIKISGDGEVTAKIAPRLEGKLRATILEAGGIDVSGSITVTDPIEMFPEKRFEKELFNKSTNIPLWAILVAVLRFRAGVRAGIGPGVFRNITVTGSYSIGKAGEPSFSITGEMFIPAFVEGYVGFGAGLGLDVLLGSLTGGIEAMGTAGIYGAISVVPELEYKDGDYSISGVATMAAGARLKLSLNAWAEIEALWITVWDNTWELASVTMPVGPDLGLSATMAYTFGKPEAPTLEFNTSDVDTDKLVSDAMPKDGPPSAGVKQETKNAAKWAGAQKAKGSAADAVPPELAKKADMVPPVAVPGGKGKKKGGKPGDAKPEDAKNPATPDPKAHGTVAGDKAASTKTPRHPAQVTLAMLDEPPAPMPRTKEQQEMDVEAAAKMVEAISAQGSDTDTLDDNFARIKDRFVLGSIDYLVEPGPSVSVQISVNPVKTVKLHELIKNMHPKNPGKDDETRVVFSHDVLVLKDGAKSYSDTVGTKMVAEQLTPYHPQGSGPASSAQANIFSVLPTQGATGNDRFIKGHLLNDNLGGPGLAENMFPITHQANVDHKAAIETEAKKRVNDQHYWARYEVVVKNRSVTALANGDFAVNADLQADLWLLGTTKGEQTKIDSVTIESRLNVQGASTAAKPVKDSTIGFDKLSDAEIADLKTKKVKQTDVLESTAGATLTLVLDKKTRQALEAVRDAPAAAAYLADLGSANSLRKRLEGAPGLGPVMAGTVFDAAAAALKADAKTTDPSRDIASMMGGALSPLRAANNFDTAKEMIAICDQLAAESTAWTYFNANRSKMTLDALENGDTNTKEVMEELIKGFEFASFSDRLAMAGLFGDHVAASGKLTKAGVRRTLAKIRIRPASPMYGHLNSVL